MRGGGASLRCNTRASHCSASLCGAQALGPGASVVVVPRLQSTGSVVVVHGPSFSEAYGIFPRPGFEPVSPALVGGVIPWTTREVPLL